MTTNIKILKHFKQGKQIRGINKCVWKYMSPVLFVLLLTVMLQTIAAAQPRVYVTHHCRNNVTVLDAATNSIISSIIVGDGPYRIAIAPNGSRAYTPNHLSDNVSVIDTATNTVIATIPVGDSPFGVGITPDGTRAYVTNGNSNSVSVIDTATNTVVNTIFVGVIPAE